MNMRYFLFLLIFVLATGIMVVQVFSSLHLYQTTLQETKTRLRDNAISVSNVIQVFVDEGLTEEQILKIFREAHESQTYLSHGYEFVLGRRSQDQIQFLLEHRYKGKANGPVPIKSKLAEPMRRALNKETGTIVALDYRGENVVAAFTPVAGTDWGLVTKVDLKAIRDRFIAGAIFSAMGGVVVVILGSLFVHRLTRPLRKRLEADGRQMEEVIKGIGTGIIVMKTNGVIRQVNPSAQLIFGYAAQEILGKNFSTLIPPHDMTADNHDPNNIVIGDGVLPGGGFHSVEARHKNQSVFSVGLNLTKAEIAGESLLIASILDISDKIKAEKQRQEAEIAAEAAKRTADAKSRFLANMSHEIRTPMNSVIGFAELAIGERGLPKTIRGHLEKVLVSARGLLNIINDILDFSKIESGKLELESLCFNLSNVVRESLQTFLLEVEDNGLTLNYRPDVNLPECVEGDPSKLRQVLINLVGNAVKFTKEGNVTVFAKQESDLVYFRVVDTGIGMSKEQVDHIFDSFTQADATTARRYGGTGLGTTISRRIVNAMGGEIWVTSELGLGSTFHFTVHLPETDSGPHCYLQEMAPREKLASSRHFNILLVEDNELNAELIQLNLGRELKHQITWLINGLQAVDQIKAGNRYDLILMDYQMPVMNGLQATRVIRDWEKKNGGYIPIIALTASATVEEQRRCQESGMDGFIRKPIELMLLLAEMERLVGPEVAVVEKMTQVNARVATPLVFEPLKAVADVDAALRIWHEPIDYLQGLEMFCSGHRNDAAKLEAAIRAGDLAEALRIAHTLKGLSLGLTRIAELAAAINHALKSNKTTEAAEHLPALALAIGEAVKAIKKISLLNCPDVVVDSPENVDVLDLFERLMEAIATDNPEPAQPLLNQFAAVYSERQLTPLRNCLMNYDFRGAEREAQKLMAVGVLPEEADDA